MRRKPLFHALSFYTLGFLLIAIPLTAMDSAPHQALINPDFSQPLIGDDPPGWFRAMIPGMTASLDAGRGDDSGEFHLYLTQKGPKPNLFNNWAQRLDNPPIGATLTLTAEIATDGVTGSGAAALIMLFDAAGEPCGVATTEQKVALAGDTAWTPIAISTPVPPNAATAIIRFGFLPGSEGTLKVRRASLMIEGGDASRRPTPTSPPDGPQAPAAFDAGLELLKNGDFEGGVIASNPIGWFRAMIPEQTVELDAGLEAAEGRGHVAFISQKGLTARLINNWAQRVALIPIGATLRLEADVKTETPENAGFAMAQCWGGGERLLAAATTQTSQPLGGAADWKKVACEISVPPGTETIIVRCGLSLPGRIWFDNVSLKIVSVAPPPAAPALSVPPPPPTSPDAASSANGVKVDEAYLKQLGQARAIATKVEAAAREALPPAADCRLETFALGDGKFDVVVHLDLSNPAPPQDTPTDK